MTSQFSAKFAQEREFIEEQNESSEMSLMEGNTLAMEAYKEAMRDDMGLIYIKMALSLLDKKAEKSEEFTQSMEFLDEKLQQAGDNERPYYEKLKSVFSNISEKKHTSADITEALDTVKMLDAYIKKSIDKVESGYYKIFG